jgi:hypothetical protein
MQGPLLHRCTTYGAATGDSGAVSVDPGGSANTEGSYSEITAGTTHNIKSLLIVVGTAGNGALSAANWLIDIATGTGGSEQILIPNLCMGAALQSDFMIPAVFGPFVVDIASGTRLAARAQCSITDATDRLFDMEILGLD